MDSNFQNGIDAVVAWPNGRAYFFKGDLYLRYDMAAGRVDQDPKPISGFWPGWPTSWAGHRVQGGIVMNSTTAYFFCKGEYLRYDVAADAVLPGYPRPIIGYWPGWPAAWQDGPDGCVGWLNSTVYFFKGTEYIRYDLNEDRVIGGPYLTYERWGNWPAHWASGSNGGFIPPGGSSAYLFRGPEYIRYDIASDATVAGFPMSILTTWVGWPGYTAPTVDQPRAAYTGRIDIYSFSNRDLYVSRFNNNDDVKSFPSSDGDAIGHGLGENGHLPPGRMAFIQNISAPYMQVVIDTRDGDGENSVPTRGFLVTDLATSNNEGWIIIADAADGWDFRTGSGHKYRVKAQPIAFFTQQWIENTSGAMLKGTGPAKGDTWPTWWHTPDYKQGPTVYPDLWPAPIDLYQVRGTALYHSRLMPNGSEGQVKQLIEPNWDKGLHMCAVHPGWFYVVTTAGELQISHCNAIDEWDIRNKVIGTGWQQFTKVFAGRFGQLYAIDALGDLYYSEHNPLLQFTILHKKIGNGWGGFSRVFSGGNNRIYAITASGDLLSYLHGSNQQWIHTALKIGNGWSSFQQVVSSGGGAFFAIEAEFGHLRAYLHDTNNQWYNATGRKIDLFVDTGAELMAATR